MSEKQDKSNSILTPIQRVAPNIIGLTFGFGFSQWFCRVISEATGWGFYSPATIGIAAVISGASAALTAFVAAMAMNSVGKTGKS